MCDEKYREICDRYYRLSKQTDSSPEYETAITEILQLSLEDPHLSSLIDAIDNQLCSEADYIPNISESDLTIDLFKIQEFIKAHTDENSFSSANTSPAADILIKFVEDLVLSSSPSEILLTFQKVFIKGDHHLSDAKVSGALNQLTIIEYSEQTFSCVIHDCLYIVVNKWMIKPSHHTFIAQLISLFEQREILKFSGTQKSHITKALLDFTQTDRFIRLFRLANCIRYQIYLKAEDKGALKRVESMLSNGLMVQEPRQDVVAHPIEPKVLQQRKRVPMVVSNPRSDREEKKNQLDHKASTAQVLNKNLLNRIQTKIAKVCKQATLGSATRKKGHEESSMLGVVETPLISGRLGSVKVNGIFWRAQLSKRSSLTCLEQGERIRVVGRCNITLIVEAYKEPANRAVTFDKPIVGVTKDPIAFGQIGKIVFRGTTRDAKLHEGFSYDRLHTHQKVQVVAKEGDLLVITPCSPSLAPGGSSYNSRRLLKSTQ